MLPFLIFFIIMFGSVLGFIRNKIIFFASEPANKVVISKSETYKFLNYAPLIPAKVGH